MGKQPLSQIELVEEYFTKHPNKNIEHPEIVDWVISEWNKRTGKVFRDPDRIQFAVYSKRDF
jgi:hypothetical protein